MHITSTLCRPGFHEIVADKFRAVVRHENVEKLRAYLGLSPKQLVSRATKNRGERSRYASRNDFQRNAAEAIRAGIRGFTNGTPMDWKYGDRKSRVECERPAAELARQVASCPYSELPFWSYCWAYASAREGLHVFDDSVSEEVSAS